MYTIDIYKATVDELNQYMDDVTNYRNVIKYTEIFENIRNNNRLYSNKHYQICRECISYANTFLTKYNCDNIKK